MDEIVVALIGLSGVILTAGIGVMRVQLERKRLNQAEHEVRFQRAALGFPEFVEEWGEIGAELIKLMEETTIDRFMVLRAWNGHLEPRWTTAVYQLRAAGQAPVAYIHFELDQDYISRVQKIVQEGPQLMVTAKLPHSEIKRVYKAEGVTASMWAHLDTFQSSDGVSKALAYCSFGTHSHELIDDATQTRCRILVGRLKGLAVSFDRNRNISSLRP